MQLTQAATFRAAGQRRAGHPRRLGSRRPHPPATPRSPRRGRYRPRARWVSGGRDRRRAPGCRRRRTLSSARGQRRRSRRRARGRWGEPACRWRPGSPVPRRRHRGHRSRRRRAGRWGSASARGLRRHPLGIGGLRREGRDVPDSIVRQFLDRDAALLREGVADGEDARLLDLSVGPGPCQAERASDHAWRRAAAPRPARGTGRLAAVSSTRRLVL